MAGSGGRQQRVDAVDQLALRRRLDEVILGALAQAPDAVGFHVLVLTMMIGMPLVAGSLESERVAWKPFMPGRITSMRTRSGSSRLHTSMPSSAEPAESTWCPFFSSTVANTLVSVGESSMIRMRAILVPCDLTGFTCGLRNGGSPIAVLRA